MTRSRSERYTSETPVRAVSALHAWVLTSVGTVVVLAMSSLFAPRAVFDHLLWTHLLGPAYARAHGATCAVWTGQSAVPLGSPDAC